MIRKRLPSANSPSENHFRPCDHFPCVKLPVFWDGLIFFRSYLVDSGRGKLYFLRGGQPMLTKIPIIIHYCQTHDLYRSHHPKLYNQSSNKATKSTLNCRRWKGWQSKCKLPRDVPANQRCDCIKFDDAFPYSLREYIEYMAICSLLEGILTRASTQMPM